MGAREQRSRGILPERIRLHNQRRAAHLSLQFDLRHELASRGFVFGQPFPRENRQRFRRIRDVVQVRGKNRTRQGRRDILQLGGSGHLAWVIRQANSRDGSNNTLKGLARVVAKTLSNRGISQNQNLANLPFPRTSSRSTRSPRPHRTALARRGVTWSSAPCATKRAVPGGLADPGGAALILPPVLWRTMCFFLELEIFFPRRILSHTPTGASPTRAAPRRDVGFARLQDPPGWVRVRAASLWAARCVSPWRIRRGWDGHESRIHNTASPRQRKAGPAVGATREFAVDGHPWCRGGGHAARGRGAAENASRG